ncbi:fungal-specific transcription factor domain-containing protein [Thelonectria olida]|uniref:Fungal-specific transcription factor domain-containing protein n=1 Tax=Thelonectria olida TaxID=1576542 RepID=A0A9P8VVI6_9HYPO|nr:fungal-specific transcription factor domain-containing protein [Thelonectria olida]
MASKANAPKKVRLACRRCRTRRIKCDGEVPACTNCAKAGEVCLDVDNQNSGMLVPRNFASAARARIQWLEDIIRDRLPNVDLAMGPQIDACPDPSASSMSVDREHGDEDEPSPPTAVSMPSRADRQAIQPSRQQSLKRPAEEPSDTVDASFPERAHSIAYNLGMLSLNSDSSQRHYLGSSSGLLFTHLIGATPSSAGSPSVAGAEVSEPDGNEWAGEGSALDASKQYYRSLFTFLRQELPRREDALLLVRTYIQWIHPEYPVLESSSLLSALDALYMCAQQPLEDDNFPHGWPSHLSSFRWNGRQMFPHGENGETIPMPVIAFIIFMVFNIAAIVKVRTRIYEFPPERFYRAAAQFSKDAFSQISLTSIQALVCLVVHSMLTPAEVHLWTMIHVALAHCVELGIHREEPAAGSEDFDYQNVRRFTFFTIYSLDRSVSSIQGRPLGFRDETFDIKMPDPDAQTASVDQPMGLAFSSAVTRYAILTWELDRIVSDIKLLFYHLPGTSPWFSQSIDPSSQQLRIKVMLLAWWERASSEDFSPNGLGSRQRRIWRLKLKIKYHTTMVMLFQPSQILRSPVEESLQTCFNHASCILQDYQNLYDLHCLHHGWRTVQNIFAAGATLIYSFWSSGAVRRNASNTDLSRNLRTCSSLLTIGGEWWPSVKRGQESFGSLADLTLQRLYIDATPSKFPRLTRRQHAMDPHHTQTSTPSDRNAPPLLGLNPSEVPEGPDNGESFDLQAAGLALPSTQDSWQDTNFEIPSHESNELFPEIENFLAEFDRSEFIWSFSLNALGDQYNMGNLPDSTE